MRRTGGVMMLRRGTRRSGFTLIEVLVVVAIIALLIAILLPSLQSAREHAKTVVCSSNLHHVGLATANYLYVSKGVYPPSYVYPEDELGSWRPETQSNDKPHGYLHWSDFLYDGGQVNDKAFQCPKYDNGGAPRTNPGDDQADWEAGQIDDFGQTQAGPDNIEDKQAPRIAYAANAAIVPRNKFTQSLSGSKRVNVFVRESLIKKPGDTILAAELINNWKAMAVPDGGGSTWLSKSHRPITPFRPLGSAAHEPYKVALNTPTFIYGTNGERGATTNDWGIEPWQNVRNQNNLLESGLYEINLVGRHHPTADRKYREKFGGTANFLFCDSHVETLTLYETIEARKWGERFYSISGNNEVINYIKQY